MAVTSVDILGAFVLRSTVLLTRCLRIGLIHSMQTCLMFYSKYWASTLEFV